MSLILSHKTACEYWLSALAVSCYLSRMSVDGSGCVAQAAHRLQLLAFDRWGGMGRDPLTLRRNGIEGMRAPTAAHVRDTLATLAGFTAPYHVLTFNPAARRTAKDVTYHLCTQSLPLPSFYELPDAFRAFVVSPEFCFLQMAPRLSLIDRVRLAYLLCAQFGLTDGGVVLRAPVTDVAYLRRSMKRFKEFSGAKTALSALDWVADGAASPREVALSMMMSMPCRRGGYGFPVPQLNRPFGAGGRGLRWGEGYVCDLYWPQARLALEYDSDAWHVGTERINADAKRRGALALYGVDVLTVTNDQLKSIDEMDRIAAVVGRRLGRRVKRAREYDYRERQRCLRRELLGGFPRQDLFRPVSAFS